MIKSDTLKTEVEKFIEQKVTMLSLSVYAMLPKMLSCKAIEQLGKRIIECHKPLNANYRKKFGVTVQNEGCVSSSAHKNIKPTNYYCAGCKKDIESNVAKFCWNDKNRFNGRAYCDSCQENIE